MKPGAEVPAAEARRAHLDTLRSGARALQGAAFSYLLDATATPVEWAYEVWDEMFDNLSHEDNRVRSIAAQVLCNLAKSDPEERMLEGFSSLLDVTRDERFVTARHCMQSLWKVAVVGERQRRMVVAGLEGRFRECSTEKNATLIRYDILENLRKMYDEAEDESIKDKALELIELEQDAKYRKKYSRLWR